MSHASALEALRQTLASSGCELQHVAGVASDVISAVARAAGASRVYVSAEPEERVAAQLQAASAALLATGLELRVCALPLWTDEPAGEVNYRQHAKLRGQLIPPTLGVPAGLTIIAAANTGPTQSPSSSPSDPHRGVPDTEAGAIAALRAFCGLADDASVRQAADEQDAARPGTSFAVLFERAFHLGILSPRLIAATANEALAAHLRGELRDVSAVRRARSALHAAERSAFHTALALQDRRRAAASDDICDEAAIRQRWWRWRGVLVPYIHVPAAPGGSPASNALLVHGFGAFGEHWRRQWGPLSSSGTTVWCPTLPGFGRSEKAALPYSQEFWTRYLADFAEQVIAGGPVVVAGNSIGGFMSANLACDYAHLVAGLVLLNSAGPIRDESEPSPARGTPPALVVNTLTALLLAYLERTVATTLRRCYPAQPDNADSWLAREIERASADDGAFSVFASVFYLPPPRALNALVNSFGKPTLILNGALDPLNDASKRARDLAARCNPRNVSMTLLQAGHCPHDEAPADVNAALMEFIGKATAA